MDKNRLAKSSRQQGVMLLEALLAILVFSIGILAVVGMQAASVKAVADAKYRADASFLANQVIGEMWINRTNLASYAYSGGTPPSVLTGWVYKVSNSLPGVSNSVNNPTVVIGANNTVTVTIRWQPPKPSSAVASNVHNYVVATSIN